MIICVEGVDNTGKSSLIKRLVTFYGDLATYIDTQRYWETDFDDNKDVPFELLMEYNIKSEQMEMFKRNYNVYLMALELQKKYKYVFVDRCWLSFSYYNCITKLQENAIKNLALASYINLILYFEGEVELKDDEEQKIERIIHVNDKFKHTKNCVLLPHNSNYDETFRYAVALVEQYTKLNLWGRMIQ